MALQVKHNFVSSKADGVDSTLVQPSNWNDAHVITLASAKIIVGNGSNVGAEVSLSGDGTLDNTGALTITKINGKTVTLGGNLTMSGAYTFTGTLTGTTAVTFPTSGTLTAKENANVWDAQQTAGAQPLTDAATVAIAITKNIWTLTTTAARTIGAPTGGVANTSYRLVLTSGGYTPAWNTVFKFPGGVVPSSLTGTCIFDFHYDGTNFNCTGQSVGEA